MPQIDTAGVRADTTPFILWLIFISTIGPLLFGFHLAELNAPEAILTCRATSYSPNAYLSPLPKCIPMTEIEFGLVTSIFTLGGLVGALCAGTGAAKHGRLKTMRYTTITFTLGPIAEATAPYVWTMAFGRFISGLGAGAALVVVPIYISEIAPPQGKGFFGALTQVMINLGIFIAQLLGLFLSRGQLWRIILGVGGVVGLNQLAGLFFAVESPKWSLDHGFPREAKRDLQKIRGRTVDIDAEVEGWGVEHEASRDVEEQALLRDDPTLPRSQPELRSHSISGKKAVMGIFEVLVHPNYYRSTVAVIVVMIAQQLTGINSIIMYGVGLLSDLLSTSSALLNVFVAVINVGVTIGCAPLIDTWGRKPCLIMSIGGMGISAFLLAIAILNHISIMAAVMVLTFVGSFGIGLGAVPFILSSELVGPEAVGATQSWALAANWISTFVVAQFFPIVNKALGNGKIYFIFAALAAFFASFVAWWVPETKGKKSAEEVWGREVVIQRHDD